MFCLVDLVIIKGYNIWDCVKDQNFFNVLTHALKSMLNVRGESGGQHRTLPW